MIVQTSCPNMKYVSEQSSVLFLCSSCQVLTNEFASESELRCTLESVATHDKLVLVAFSFA